MNGFEPDRGDEERAPQHAAGSPSATAGDDAETAPLDGRAGVAAGEIAGLPLSGGASRTLMPSSDGPPPPNFPGLLILEAVPGAGGMGFVYKARELSLDRIVAVKTTRPHLWTNEGREFFLREARAAASLDHPNILKIHRFSPEHTPPFYVMQWVEGRPLGAACRGRDPRFVAALVEKVARALAYAHGRGVVHRDIKPDNILVDLDNEPHVVDFGLAGRMEEAAAEADAAGGETKAPSLFGTPAYIPPEVYEAATGRGADGDAGEANEKATMKAFGAARPGPAVDVYALGVTLYQLLSGRTPFTGRTLAEVRRAVLEADPPLPQELEPSVPEPLQRVCLQAMERDPSRRYASAGAMADDLRRFLDGRDVAARPTRYDVEVRGRLQNHLTDIRRWHEQSLIDVAEMDRLSRPYRAILDAVSPWARLSKRFPWETLVLRLGGWLVLLGSVLWPRFYWEELTRPQRVLAVGFPALAINLAGWVLHARGSRTNALIFLSTGALLLPLFVAALLSEYRLVPRLQDQGRELFHHPTDGAPSDEHEIARGPDGSDGAFDPTNFQITLAAGAFVAYCVLVLAATRATLLAFFLGVGVYCFYGALMLLAGIKFWIENEQVARACVAGLCLAMVFWPASALLDRRPALRPYSGVFLLFFSVPFVAFLDLLARYGAVEWLGASPEWDDERINLWVMANGLILFAAALWFYRSRSSASRFWGAAMMLLVPVHLLTPTHLLFEKGRTLFTAGGVPFTTYELASGVIALGLIVLATRLRLHALAFTALLGVASFVFRATDLHFHHYVSWPLSLALVGGVLMSAALAVLIVRSRRQRDGSL